MKQTARLAIWVKIAIIAIVTAFMAAIIAAELFLQYAPLPECIYEDGSTQLICRITDGIGPRITIGDPSVGADSSTRIEIRY